MKNGRRILSGCAVLGLLSASACSSVHERIGHGEGKIYISADERGMDSLWEGLVGVITETKASSDVESAFYTTRKNKHNGRLFSGTSRRSNKRPQRKGVQK